MQLTPILMAITCAYKDKVETHVLLQGSNYLFRSDPQRFRETFQQLEGIEECCKPPIGGLDQNAIRIQENSIHFNTFWSKI